MSQRITILPETITNKIAAGEVVERPASVIKELIENSLDAGATDIAVEVSSGGRRLLRVTDNGYGMSQEDALLSLERHATSKIRNEADLENILTLGFRGEALPSIASVSRFRLASRQRESLEGSEIIVEGGKVRDVKACGMPVGTVITVEHLFFNTPARLKFLKTAETESGHIGDVLTRMAVSRPDVTFSLTVDGRETLKLQRGDLLRRLGQLVGKDSSAALHQISFENEYVSLSGYLSAPSLVRSGNNSLYTYVNGRFVRDKVVQHAVMQAYKGVLDRGRYPVAALFISVPGGEVDVNVHPTKHEVRFRRQSAVHDAIQAGIEELLRTSPWLPSRQAVPATLSSDVATLPSVSQAYRERIAAAAQASLAIPKRENFSLSSQPSSTPQPQAVHDPSEPFSVEDAGASEGYFSTLAIIGQFHGEYILCQDSSTLVIIDQHAASERVAFERLRQQYRNAAVESQRLLFPETVELSFGEVAVAARFRKELVAIGFECEPFGGTTLLVSSVPRLPHNASVSALIRDILHDLQQLGASGAFRDVEDALFARIACHSVVRGFHPLDAQQIRELLRSMDNTGFAASCPHGRPVSHAVTLQELEKIFKRI